MIRKIKNSLVKDVVGLLPLQETIELDLNEAQQKDVEAFRKQFNGSMLEKYRNDWRGGKFYFLYIDPSSVFGLSNKPFMNRKSIDRSLYKNSLVGMGTAALKQSRPWLQKAVFVYTKKGLPYNIKLESGLWFVCAPLVVEVEENGEIKI
jgi:hypothetical protein